ncbi:hypothetical protein Scep_027441 [Stephania cephalantha]|uniref:Uncharacterized protein n=1 Tax=Stephania cephalantha TaxID=152367 RepID=A0AAP0EGD4_9MAGN
MTRVYAQSLINIVLSLKCRNVETIVQWSHYSSEDELLDQTKAGPVLLAMNPFKGVEVRGNELVSGCGKKPRVSPRIYYWAKDAFIAMMNNYSRSIWDLPRSILDLRNSVSQSLINIALSLKCRNVETIVQWFLYSSGDELGPGRRPLGSITFIGYMCGRMNIAVFCD